MYLTRMGPWHLSFFTFFMFLHYHLGSGRLLKSRSWTWAEALHNMRSQYGILCYARLFEILQRSRAYLFSTIAASLHIALESCDMKPIRYAPDYREYAVSLRNVYCTLLRWMLFLHIPQRKDGRPNNRKQQTKPEGEGVNSFFFFTQSFIVQSLGFYCDKETYREDITINCKKVESCIKWKQRNNS